MRLVQAFPENLNVGDRVLLHEDMALYYGACKNLSAFVEIYGGQVIEIRPMTPEELQEERRTSCNYIPEDLPFVVIDVDGGVVGKLIRDMFKVVEDEQVI